MKKNNKYEIAAIVEDTPIEYIEFDGDSAFDYYVDFFKLLKSKLNINTVGELVAIIDDCGLSSFYSKINELIKNESKYINVPMDIRERIMSTGILLKEDRLLFEGLGISEEIALMPIKNQNLSPRVINALRRRFYTQFVGDLLQIDYFSLSGDPRWSPHCRYSRNMGIGESGLVEIKELVHQLGFSLKNERLTKKELKSFYERTGVPLVGDFLGIGIETARVLYDNGLYTVDDLINYGPEVFLLDDMGAIKINNIITAMREKGIQFNVPQDEYNAIMIRIAKIQELSEKYRKLLRDNKELLDAAEEIERQLSIISDEISTLKGEENEKKL